MNAEITSMNDRYRERPLFNGCNVFVECDITDLVDSWFRDNDVYRLDFKCKTWNKLKTRASKVTIKALRTIFGDECKITYSIYAGCTCPCSPGYRVRSLNDKQYNNKSIWVTITNTEAVEALRAELPKFTEMLNKEIEENK